jgi:hypothetical protein
MSRAATGLLALIFSVTTGVAGAALHLCGMEGIVVQTCCCHESDEGPPSQIKGVDECCGALISTGEHPPVAAGSDEVSVSAQMLCLAAATTDEASHQRLTEAGRIPLARGSPGAHGPPLFIWNCSYLI